METAQLQTKLRALQSELRIAQMAIKEKDHALDVGMHALQEKQDENDTLSSTIKDHLQSLTAFHQQQSGLFEQFKKLRSKYDEQQKNTHQLLWKWIPENTNKLDHIPK
jgi:predicted  nucleic acid-binding Zn-ribbon protein